MTSACSLVQAFFTFTRTMMFTSSAFPRVCQWWAGSLILFGETQNFRTLDPCDPTVSPSTFRHRNSTESLMQVITMAKARFARGSYLKVATPLVFQTSTYTRLTAGGISGTHCIAAIARSIAAASILCSPSRQPHARPPNQGLGAGSDRCQRRRCRQSQQCVQGNVSRPGFRLPT